MNRKEIEKVETTSINIAAEQKKQLKAIFPEVFTEDNIDFAKLQATLGNIVDDRPERYSFTWAGKREAIQMLQTPSKATLKPDKNESVDFDNTQNLFIEGDNLEVLKLIRKSYPGQVKMIYIDPPYNTGNDFIYPDNYTDPLDNYLELTGQKDSEGNLQTSNLETSGRYHSAWLSMMYPRLFLARQLLREDGVIFVSIDDHEVHNLRLLMNEIFGEENFLGVIIWKGATDNNPTRIAVEHEYIVCFARNQTNLPSSWKNNSNDAKNAILQEYNRLKIQLKSNVDAIQQELRRFIKIHQESLNPITHYNRVDKKGVYIGSRKVHNPKAGGYNYDVIHPVTGKVCIPPTNGYRYPKERMNELISEGRILFGDDETQIIQIKEYLIDYESKLASVIHLYSRVASVEMNDLFPDNNKIFTNSKPRLLLKNLFSFCLDSQDLIVDFFAGSATTAQAVLDLNHEDGGNRKFILVQLPQKTDNPQFPTIADISKERIRRSIQKIKNSDNGKLPLQNRETPEDLGFKVLKLSKSNYRQSAELPSDTDTEAYIEQLELFNDPLVDGWKLENVIYEVMLKQGYSLTSRIEQVTEIESATIYKITDEDKRQHFYISLDNQFHFETARTLKLTKNDLLICRDMAIDDTTAANLVLQCRLKTI
jgi:adenine-specific DNA-methyltransferase